ncbi:MAG: SprT family zinc-dependent metalloprotease [Salaquimonas sp.]
MLAVKVVEHPKSKRITLRLLPGGNGLKITMPAYVSDRELDQFLERNKNWVAARRARLPETVELSDGASIPFRGAEHRIVHLDRLRGVVEAKIIRDEPSLLVPGDPKYIQRKLLDFLKKQAREELNHAVSRYSALLNVRPKQIRITDSTSRWGSCSSTRTLSFSWRIIMAPPEVLDYLAAHEVAHLREMNHSDRFWNHVREVCPDMERQKAWLRKNGTSLHAVSLNGV